MEVGGQSHVPVALPQERDPVPIAQEVEWSSGSVRMIGKISTTPPGFDPQTIQPITSPYTN